MKKIFVLSILTVIIFSCSKKVTPTTETFKPSNDQVGTVTVEGEKAPEANVAAGKTVYEAKCGRCHDLPEPPHFTATKWVGLVNWMAPKARLTDTEKADVLAYVQANAKKS